MILQNNAWPDREYGNGVSSEAAFLHQTQWQSVQRKNELSATLGRGKIKSELAELWHGCRHADWDGGGAMAVEIQTVHAAVEFLQALPSDIPQPEVAADPEGLVNLEWHRARRWVLSVSIDSQRTVYYAAMFGSETVRGKEHFYREVSPTLLRLIRKATANA